MIQDNAALIVILILEFHRVYFIPTSLLFGRQSVTCCLSVIMRLQQHSLSILPFYVSFDKEGSMKQRGTSYIDQIR